MEKTAVYAAINDAFRSKSPQFLLDATWRSD
jgi:hypothetical protein